jgi:hypothetical protein
VAVAQVGFNTSSASFTFTQMDDGKRFRQRRAAWWHLHTTDTMQALLIMQAFFIMRTTHEAQ